jgi:pimeloyl-ACP methyl ester carboxylesterase
MRRVQRSVLVGVAIVTATLAACSGDATPGEDGAAEVRLHPCVAWAVREIAWCGTVPVPENRATRTGRTIGIHVMVLRARSAPVTLDPIVFLPGGPGQGAASMAGYVTGALGSLRDGHDVVLADQRGTGRSHPLDCDLYEDAGRAQPFVDPMFPLAAVRRCAERVVADADPTQYTTSSSADDLDDVRSALGAKRLDLYGASYGTRLALEYMRRHPTHVRSATLLSVIPPESPIPLAAASAGEHALELAISDCAAEPRCHAGAPDPRADIAHLLGTVRTSPPQVRIWNSRRLSYETVVLTPRGVAERIWGAAYAPGALVDALPSIHRAALGDYGDLARRMVRESRQRRWGKSEGLMLSLLCAEDAPRLARVDTSAGSAPLGRPIASELLQACEAWPHHEVEASFYQPVRSDAPTLIISGARDPITPPELADSARRTLSHAVAYLDPQGGHGSLDDRAQRLLVEFINDPDGFVARWRGDLTAHLAK